MAARVGMGMRVTPSDLRIGGIADAHAGQNAQETADVEELQVQIVQQQSQLESLRAHIMRLQEQCRARDSYLGNFQASLSQNHSSLPVVQEHIAALGQLVAERRKEIRETLQNLDDQYTHSFVTQAHITQMYQGVRSLEQQRQSSATARAVALGVRIALSEQNPFQ